MNTTIYRNYAMAVLTGETTYRSDYPDPSKVVTVASERFETYKQLLAYYQNTAFDRLSQWARYKRQYNLYEHTRGIFNPVTRIVDFYVDHVYPGTLSVDGKELPNGVQSSIPLSQETPKELARAIGATWEWSKWQAKSAVAVNWGALTGNVLVEIVDDLVKGQIRYKPIWAGFVPKIKLNDVGDLEAYVVEYNVIDPATGLTFCFAKEVQPDFIAYYRDGQLIRTIPNPYGFVPAVWIKHKDFGGDYGVPATGHGRGKFDEVNSLASHSVDHVHKQINSPRVLWSKGTIKNLFASGAEDPAFNDRDFDTRQDTMMLKGPEGGTTDTLVGNLDAATTVPIIAEILREIERDFPETTMYDKLREMHQVTGPAAAKMMGDVENKLRRASDNYDIGSTSLFAMGVAIAGFRASSGAWGSQLTPQQKLFVGFGLDSYNRGELVARILPRPLVVESTKDVADEVFVRAQAVAQVTEDMPAEEKFRMMGKREDEIPGLVAALKAEKAAKAAEVLALETAKAKAAPKGEKPTRGE